MAECRKVHLNMPAGNYLKMLRNVNPERYLNVSDAARHYIRISLQTDEVKD